MDKLYWVNYLENRICELTIELAMLEGKVAPRYQVHGIEKQIDILEDVLEKVETQQKLINKNNISLN